MKGANAKAMGRAIRAKCLDCCGGVRAEVRGCRIEACPLWPFRGVDSEATERRETGDEGIAPTGERRILPGQIDIREVLRTGACRKRQWRDCY